MSKISKKARLGLAIQWISMIAIFICVFLSKPISDIWEILFVSGGFVAIVSEIIGAGKKKAVSNQ